MNQLEFAGSLQKLRDDTMSEIESIKERKRQEGLQAEERAYLGKQRERQGVLQQREDQSWDEQQQFKPLVSSITKRELARKAALSGGGLASYPTVYASWIKSGGSPEDMPSPDTIKDEVSWRKYVDPEGYQDLLDKKSLLGMQYANRGSGLGGSRVPTIKNFVVGGKLMAHQYDQASGKWVNTGFEAKEERPAMTVSDATTVWKNTFYDENGARTPDWMPFTQYYAQINGGGEQESGADEYIWDDVDVDQILNDPKAATHFFQQVGSMTPAELTAERNKILRGPAKNKTKLVARLDAAQKYRETGAEQVAKKNARKKAATEERKNRPMSQF